VQCGRCVGIILYYYLFKWITADILWIDLINIFACSFHYIGMSFFKGYIMMYNRYIILHYPADSTVNAQVFHFWSSKVFVKWQPTGGHLKTNIGIRYPTLGTLSSVYNNIILRGIGIHYLIYVFSRTYTI